MVLEMGKSEALAFWLREWRQGSKRLQNAGCSFKLCICCLIATLKISLRVAHLWFIWQKMWPPESSTTLGNYLKRYLSRSWCVSIWNKNLDWVHLPNICCCSCRTSHYSHSSGWQSFHLLSTTWMCFIVIYSNTLYNTTNYA